MSDLTRFVTHGEDSINLDIGIENKWNWSWLEKKINKVSRKLFCQ